MKIEYEFHEFRPATLALIETAGEIIAEYQAAGFRLSLRQLYYQFVARDLIENTERSYKRIGDIVSAGRRAGLLDWLAIEDRTRSLRRLTAWRGPKTILEAARDSFHRDLWAGQNLRMEVWIEKDALVDIIETPCEDNDVPFFSCRGYVSDSEMWQAATRIIRNRDQDQATIILHLGDHDPSGLDMTRDIRDRLNLFTWESSWFEVRRIALSMAQIEEVAPPPNPAKITDSRYDGYVEEYGTASWELDALEPQYLRDLVIQEIEAERNEEIWEANVERQERERAEIARIIKDVPADPEN